MVTASDIMTSPVFSIPPESTVEDAVALMLKRRVSGLPVVDADDNLVGVVTEYDLLRLTYDLETCQDAVAKYMTTRLYTVEADTSLIDITDVFLANRIRRLLVVDGQKVLGLISRRDVIQIIHDVRERIAGYRSVAETGSSALSSVPTRQVEAVG